MVVWWTSYSLIESRGDRRRRLDLRPARWLSIYLHDGGPLDQPPPRDQVVRPWPHGSSQRLDPGVGRELSSNLLSELGGNASSSPAFGGRDSPVLNRFLAFPAGMFYVKEKALSSNVRLYMAIDVKGSSCKMYLPRAK
jgi:hypothetical protein